MKIIDNFLPKKFQDEIQELTDKSISEIESLTSSKQSEILKV